VNFVTALSLFTPALLCSRGEHRTALNLISKMNGDVKFLVQYDIIIIKSFFDVYFIHINIYVYMYVCILNNRTSLNYERKKNPKILIILSRYRLQRARVEYCTTKSTNEA